MNVNRHVEKADVFSMIKSNGMVGLSSSPSPPRSADPSCVVLVHAVNLGAVGDKACRSDGDQRFMTLRSTGPGTPFTTALSVNCQKVQPSKSGLSFS